MIAHLMLGASFHALLAQRTRAFADTIEYEYDDLGRLIRVESSNGSVVEYEYDAAGNRLELNQTAPSAVTASLTASPTSIASGGSSTLTWATTNATSASIDNGVGAVSPVAGGSVAVSPTSTTTYTLTATGPGGVATSQATVTVAPPIFTATIPITGSGSVDLRALANAAGYDGARNANVTFTLASGVTLMGAAGAPNGGVAIDTGTWPTGSYSITLALQISGKVYGGGGRGGRGAQPGAATTSGSGGDAINCQTPISITVNSGGEVKGGGGGGGGGGGWFNNVTEFDASGGGGGGGFPNGTAGAAGTSVYGSGAQAGSAGTTSGGGAGGAGDGAISAHSGGAGGAGGNAAALGSNGFAGSGSTGSGWLLRANSSGGNSGYAIRKNGNTVPVTNNGTITGTQG